MSQKLGKEERLNRRMAAPLFAQVAALALISIVASQAINLWIVFNVPATPPEIYRIDEVVTAFRTEAPVESTEGRVLVVRTPRAFDGRHFNDEPIELNLSQEIARRLGTPPQNVRFSMLLDARSNARQTIRALRRFMGETGAPTGPGLYIIGPFEAAIMGADGAWRIIEPERYGMFTPWQKRILLWFAASALAMIPVAWLFARRLSAPIAAFAAAAERLGRDPGAPPLKLSGPAEIKMAVAAFNQMQDRLRRYVDDRTAMIGAVAHDLRTPLTRLRFRVETIPEPMRTKMASDVEQMDAMIGATLAFVRDASQPAARTRLNLGSLVQTIADEMSDTGADASATVDEPVVVEGDPIALRRLVTNLMDNAIKFGGRARARVYTEDETAVIEVEDEGPGLSEADHDKFFEPFFRGEPSRSRETGGAGLGLAVVRSVARAHGGDASLENRPEGGLRARARLPL